MNNDNKLYKDHEKESFVPEERVVSVFDINIGPFRLVLRRKYRSKYKPTIIARDFGHLTVGEINRRLKSFN